MLWSQCSENWGERIRSSGPGRVTKTIFQKQKQGWEVAWLVKCLSHKHTETQIPSPLNHVRWPGKTEASVIPGVETGGSLGLATASQPSQSGKATQTSQHQRNTHKLRWSLGKTYDMDLWSLLMHVHIHVGASRHKWTNECTHTSLKQSLWDKTYLWTRCFLHIKAKILLTPTITGSQLL